jgi:hypothetical protein
MRRHSRRHSQPPCVGRSRRRPSTFPAVHVIPEDAYRGPFAQFGTGDDPMIGRRVGGTITFGGGLGLYADTSAIGGLGLSGDTACADHSTAWRLREILGKDPASGDDRITLGPTEHPHARTTRPPRARNPSDSMDAIERRAARLPDAPYVREARAWNANGDRSISVVVKAV